MALPTVHKKPGDDAILRDSLAKLLKADKGLVDAQAGLAADIRTLESTMADIQARHDELIPVSEDIVKNIAIASIGRTSVERQINRRSAEQLASQKRAVDRAIVELKLRLNELKEAKERLEKSQNDAARARDTLGDQIAIIKEYLGDVSPVATDVI